MEFPLISRLPSPELTWTSCAGLLNSYAAFEVPPWIHWSDQHSIGLFFSHTSGLQSLLFWSSAVYFCIDLFANVWCNMMVPMRVKPLHESIFFALHHAICIIGLVHSAVTKRDGGFILLALLFAELSNPVRLASSILSRIGVDGKEDPAPTLRYCISVYLPRSMRPNEQLVFGSFVLSRFACLQLTLSTISSNLTDVTYFCAWSLISLSACAILRQFVS